MAEKRMQVREHLTLGAFSPPEHPILVTCEKCGRCATLLKFAFPREPQTDVVHCLKKLREKLEATKLA